MRVYLELVKAAFQARATYKMDFFLRLFSRVLGLFVQVAIWRAVIGETGGVASTMGTVSLREMVTYVVASTSISIFVSLFADTSPLARMQSKIQSGEISMDLVKPVGVQASLFCQTLGSNLFDVLSELLPLVGIGVLVFRMGLPSWLDLLLFTIALVNGLIIYFIISYILGLLTFWYWDVWHFERFLAELLWLFSGSRIPLWFFPPLLLKVSVFLPFRLVYFVPIAIYLGKMEPIEGIAAIAQQFLWIGVLLLLERIVWARGIRKLVVQGG